jgi:hypothetical protein
MWLFNKKRAELVAQSISQLIHVLSAGREDHGPTGPERLLRSLAPFLSEDTIIGQRVVKLLVAMAGKARFFVSLATAPDHSGHRLTIDWARHLLGIFPCLRLAAAHGDDRFAAERRGIPGAPALCRLQGDAQRGRASRLSVKIATGMRWRGV